MTKTNRYFNILLVVLILSFFVVSTVFAQDGDNGTPSVDAIFAPILAASVAIERLLQLIRNVISPDPEKGLLARGTSALHYYTTIGGIVLGLVIALTSDLRILNAAGIAFNPTLDGILTGITIGLGSEFFHEVIGVVGEGKKFLRGK